MIHVAIIIITYRRILGLEKLLAEIERQQCLGSPYPFRLTVIIVDNDCERSAAAIVENFNLRGTVSIRYVVENAQGIPQARNAGMALIPENAEFFCFIDDDEWPSRNWVSELLATQHATNADSVLGPVIPVYPNEAPVWLVKSRIFDGKQFLNHKTLKAGASNNVLISTAFIHRTGIMFDERMRMTGGSDYHFFRQAIRLGMHIVWSAKADVYEDLPSSRMTLRWIFQRQYRLGNTFALSERLAGSRAGLAKWMSIGVARICLGFVMLPTILFSPYYGMRAIAHLLRGAGILAGICGHAYKEYSPRHLAQDRQLQPKF